MTPKQITGPVMTIPATQPSSNGTKSNNGGFETWIGRVLMLAFAIAGTLLSIVYYNMADQVSRLRNNLDTLTGRYDRNETQIITNTHRLEKLEAILHTSAAFDARLQTVERALQRNDIVHDQISTEIKTAISRLSGIESLLNSVDRRLSKKTLP